MLIAVIFIQLQVLSLKPKNSIFPVDLIKQAADYLIHVTYLLMYVRIKAVSFCRIVPVKLIITFSAGLYFAIKVKCRQRYYCKLKPLLPAAFRYVLELVGRNMPV